MTASMPQPEPRSDFALFARTVKLAVDAHIDAIAMERVTRATRVSPDAGAVVTALFDLATRGGKRVRPVLLGAAHLACGGAKADPVAIAAGAAIEILHAYLLVHDDWMDDDDVRRGGPSVHTALRARFASRADGDACAILAGDFGQAVAFEVLASLEAPPERVLRVMTAVSHMLADVVMGQIVDVRRVAATREEVETMHRLKTSSYTTSGPLAIGATLAGADEQMTAALRDAGDALGIAFQLKDDLLGTFGDSARTGKSARSDLRRGKRTALVAELADDREAQRLLPRVLGVEDAPDEEVDALVDRMVRGGAKARVEARLAALTAEARTRIERLSLGAEGKSLLMGAIEALSARRE